MADKSDDSQDDQQERPLEPTERKLQKARDEGQFPQARDLTTFIVLIVFLIAAVTAATPIFAAVVALTREAFTFNDPELLIDYMTRWGGRFTSGVAVPLLLLFTAITIAGLISPLALVKFNPKFSLKFKIDKLSLIKGLKRIFSLTTILELSKTLLKVILIFAVGILFIYLSFPAITSLPRSSTSSAIAYAISLIGKSIIVLLVPIAIVALVDTALQQFNFKKKMRMTYDELKKELKETDGSPEIKLRQRQRQRQLASARMMAALERADVVIVNPEHYSVALRYDIKTMQAPIVVAKGKDEIALRMQAIARERKLPIAQIPPLARYIYRQIKLGGSIPEFLFEATAKIIAWAYKSKENLVEIPIPYLDGIESLDKQ